MIMGMYKVKNNTDLCIGFVLGSLLWTVFWWGLIYVLHERKQLGHLKIESNDIPAINASVKNINAGGCGYFAMKLYERLDTSVYSIVVINNGDHIAILENETGNLIDANGYNDKLHFQLMYRNVFNKITYDSLKTMVADSCNWNRTFNRKDTVIINKFIERL